MSTEPTDTPESWVLFRPGYSYLAIPVSKLSAFLNTFKIVKEGYENSQTVYSLADDQSLDMKLVSGEHMTVMQVRAKILPDASK